MALDKSAAKRSEYNCRILEKERLVDDMVVEKRKVLETIEDLDNDMRSGFSRLMELNEEMIRKGSHAAQWAQDEYAGKKAS